MDRIASLNDILTQHPNDTFARYGLAMDTRAGRLGSRWRVLHPAQSQSRLHSGYFMAAQLWFALTAQRREDDADRRHCLGPRTGNLHAQSEMEAMLAELG